MENQDKLNELYDLKLKIESREFQEYIMKPLYAEMDKLKNAYDCQSLRELSEVKGKKQGLKFIIGLLKRTEKEIKDLKYELEK